MDENELTNVLLGLDKEYRPFAGTPEGVLRRNLAEISKSVATNSAMRRQLVELLVGSRGVDFDTAGDVEAVVVTVLKLLSAYVLYAVELQERANVFAAKPESEADSAEREWLDLCWLARAPLDKTADVRPPIKQVDDKE